MKVLKFGGSSVANATNISRVLDIIEASAAAETTIVISSAISGCTDKLIEIGRKASAGDSSFKDIVSSLREKHLVITDRLFTGAERTAVKERLEDLFAGLDSLADSIFRAGCISEGQKQHIQTFGELFSTTILAAKLSCEGRDTLWLDSRDIVRTCEGNLDETLTYSNIAASLRDGHRIYVAPGFVARDENGDPVTLGRGGSDYSAAIFAAAAGADGLEIWTDVPGMMSANPKVVPQARTISTISYEAALELASHGAKVLYAPTVHPAMKAGIAFSIRNTFDPGNPGTVISAAVSEVPTWKGVTSEAVSEDEARVLLCGEKISNRESALQRIADTLKDAGIRPTGNVDCSDGCFFIPVRRSVADDAVVALHREFFESRQLTTTDVFIAGYGAVGKALLELVESNEARIAKKQGRSIRIAGIANSTHYIVDMKGIRPEEAGKRLSRGESNIDEAFIDAVAEAAQPKAVFVDCTNSQTLFEQYEKLFRKGISIVTSNRRSLAIPYSKYDALKNAALENGCSFRYDTTVGTALPILESISNGANCSDSITSIEAVISCTMNYIITCYDGSLSDSFATLLKKAQDDGLTENDPRTDLGGGDALRKLLIISREAGVELEADDVEVIPMVGKEYFDCSLEDFYRKLAGEEASFIAREAELDALGKRQRFVASLTKDASAQKGWRAEIKMQLVGVESPFYWISGTENVTVIKSENSAPLIIKGAGEGARQAASGVLNDILK